MGTQFERSAETQKRLINAALALLADKGFQRTSLDQVAQKAGFSKGAVYHHFLDKGALLVAVIKQLGKLGLLWPPLPESSPELLMTRAQIEAVVFEVWVEARRQPEIRKLLLSFKSSRAGKGLALDLGEIVEHQVLAVMV